MLFAVSPYIKKTKTKNLEEHQTTSKMHDFLPKHSKLDSVHMLTWVFTTKNREKKLCSKKVQMGLKFLREFLNVGRVTLWLYTCIKRTKGQNYEFKQ